MKAKKLLLLVLMVAVCFATAGCADVTFRFTDDRGARYQTITVRPDKAWLERNGYNPTEVLEAVKKGFEDEGYDVNVSAERFEVVATLRLTDETESVLSSGYVEDEMWVEKRFFFNYVHHEGHTAFAPSEAGTYNYVYFTVLQKSLQLFGEAVDFEKLNFSYEYASNYRSLIAENGEEYTDGELKVMKFSPKDDAVVKYKYRQVNQWAWYGSLAAAVMLAATTALVITKFKKQKSV